MSLGEVSKNFIQYLRAEDQIAGCCPHCDEIFRLSEVELFYIPDRKEDFLADLRKRQGEIEQNLEEQLRQAREDAIKKSRSVLLGKLFEAVSPLLPGFQHNPRDLRGIWDPVDYVCFNGATLNGSVDSVSFIEIKTGRSTTSRVQKSIKEAVENQRVKWETVKVQAPPQMEEAIPDSLLKDSGLGQLPVGGKR